MKKGRLSEQSKRFIEAAREHGADGDVSAADELMRRLARTPKEPRAKPAKVKSNDGTARKRTADPDC